MKILTVIPLERGVFPNNLTYFSAQSIEVGSIVEAPIRSRKILSLVIHSMDISHAKADIKEMDFNLRKVTESKGSSVFRKEYINSAFEISHYFASKENITIASLIPTIFKEKYDDISKFENRSKNVNLDLLNKEQDTNIRSEKLIYQAPLEDRVSLYKTMIREAFALKKSIFFVFPTGEDIEQFSGALSKGIENFTFSMHGGISTKKIIDKFQKIVEEPHPVLILGTAPFLSIPRYDLGTIILEHESTNIYKMISRPYIDLRTFTELFASKIGARFIMADSLLRFETLARQDLDGLSPLAQLSFRLGFGGSIDIIGRESHEGRPKTSEEGNRKFQILSDESIQKLCDKVEHKKNTFIFALRKGLATMTVCTDCSDTVMCHNCQAPVVLYLSKDGQKRMFICNRCHTERSAETVCDNCQSWNLKPLGIGTDTVLESLHSLIEEQKIPSETKIFKLDRESVKTAKQARDMIKEFEQSEGGILVGTEMAILYMREKVNLSIIASFDSLWSIPNYKMGEKIISLIHGMISKTEDNVIIQTKNPKDPSIIAITTENILSFIRDELSDREKLGYPPFKRFIKISHSGTKEETNHVRDQLKEVFEDYSPDIFSGFMPRLKDKYTTNALIKMDTKKWSLPDLSLNSELDQKLLGKLLSIPQSFKVSIDPEDLL